MKIVLATGGTGGHIFPAQALAEVLIVRGATVEFMVDARFHDYVAKAKNDFPNVPIHTIHARSISGTLPRKLWAAAHNAYACMQAWMLLRHIRPDMVVGFGGYPSLPTLLMAGAYTRVLHEQNAILGKTNRLLAERVDAIITAFPHISATPQGCAEKLHYLGNPVRASIQSLHTTQNAPWDGISRLNLLVTGGSQGAAIFAETVPAALALLPPEMQQRLHVVQQVRAEQLATVDAAYAALPISYDIAPYFSDMHMQLAQAQLVISRAGASTIAEVQCAGVPAIFVPLPHAADNHQQRNAEAMVDAGAAWMMLQPDFTAEPLATHLMELMQQPPLLHHAAHASHALGTPHAATDCADFLYKLYSGSDDALDAATDCTDFLYELYSGSE